MIRTVPRTLPTGPPSYWGGAEADARFPAELAGARVESSGLVPAGSALRAQPNASSEIARMENGE